MKVSYNWLKNYINADIAVERIAEILTDIGLEVDGIDKVESVRGGLEGVLVGEVLKCQIHPDSDHLHITEVSVGSAEPLQVVCGAPNVAAGQKVLLATINATLYPAGAEEGFKIKKSKIRGVESFGMICAEDELGIGASHDGIMVLSDDAVPGTPAKDYLNLPDDYIIEIGLTPNRIDAGSHYGVARDLAAFLNANGENAILSLPSVEEFKPGDGSYEINVTVENTEAAPRYTGLTISGIKVAPSPEWLQNNLRAIGINPKNNIVDITNFVLHEVGQPLHAFDAARIAGGKVVVRTCPQGTKFTTLDGVEHTLTDNDLMICDAEKPMCIGGVMGGLDSGVTETTQAIFLESAYFNPVWVRKSARRHGVNSDSSFRFERGADPNMTVYALKRAAMLITELAGGKITSGITDILSEPSITEPFRFEFSPARANALIGKDIPTDTIRKILNSLEVSVENESDGILQVAVPPYRVDVKREADLVEDVLRIYGYNNIEIPQRVASTLSYSSRYSKEKMVNAAADFLTSNGFTEIMSNSLTKGAYYESLESYAAANCVKILNPLSADLNVMRQTLVFNMLEAVSLNINHRNGNQKFYEFGNVYRFDADKATEGGLAPYSENYRLAIGITGLESVQTWNNPAGQSNFFHLKSIAEKLLRRFGFDIDNTDLETVSNDIFSEGLSVSLKGRRQTLFTMGAIAPKIKQMFDIKQDVWFLEMDFDHFVKALNKKDVAVKPLPRFPEVRRDLALLVDKGVTFSSLRSIAFAAERKLLKSVTLFDVYEGDKLPSGKKSYALGFVLQDETQTMTDQMIDRIMGNLTTQFEQKAGATVRS